MQKDRSDLQRFRPSVEVDFESNMDGLRLPVAIEIALCRVAREALENVLEHAGASSVSVTVQQRDNEVVMVIEDDGCGFDANADGRCLRREVISGCWACASARDLQQKLGLRGRAESVRFALQQGWLGND